MGRCWRGVADLGLEPGGLERRVETVELFIPAQEKGCTFIEGESEEEKGRELALRLREAKLI